MMGLLLVEDEVLTRRGIERAIAWERLGLRLVGSTSNGREGLSLARETKPDIVLTDIRMPVMDGIEMAGEIRKILPQTRMVFLSGYSDFAYAQSAIRLGVVEYILKPVNVDALNGVLQRIVESLHAEQWKRIFAPQQQGGPLHPVLSAEEERKLVALVGRNDAVGVQACIDACFSAHASDDGSSLCLHILYLVSRHCFQNGEDCAPLWAKYTALRVPFSTQVTRAELQEELDALVGELMRIPSNPHPSYSPVVQGAVAYVRDHGTENLQVQDIAQALNVTPNYLSRIFKDEVGENLIKYLTQWKVEQAKVMLCSHPETKTYEVAQATGFSDYRYFTYIFKKYVGVTPAEFRDQRSGNGNEGGTNL
jgi:two-component system response regulator YesN